MHSTHYLPKTIFTNANIRVWSGSSKPPGQLSESPVKEVFV